MGEATIGGRLTALAGLAAVAALVLALGAGHARAAIAHVADVNCSDFSSRAVAESYFNSHSPSSDPNAGIQR
jgi:hypothetical protein